MMVDFHFDEFSLSDSVLFDVQYRAMVEIEVSSKQFQYSPCFIFFLRLDLIQGISSTGHRKMSLKNRHLDIHIFMFRLNLIECELANEKTTVSSERFSFLFQSISTLR